METTIVYLAYIEVIGGSPRANRSAKGGVWGVFRGF